MAFEYEFFIFDETPHPEYSRRYLRALIESREAIIEPLTFQSGLTSLEQPPHREEPAAWLRHFLLA